MPLLRPHSVIPGAQLGVIAPASFAQNDRVQGGLEALRSLGFSPMLSQSAHARGPLFFAGTPEQRQSDLHAAFADQNTKAILAVRGGYGSNYLLQGLDVALIQRNPKPFFAYSDLTGIQLHLLDRIGLPVFHGPMLAADFNLENGVHLDSFRAALSGEFYSVGEAEGLRLLKPVPGVDRVNGILYGGCLSILVSLLGTPWEPDTKGKLLFIEDVGAKPYQIDRMLWQLRAAGKLAGVRGIIFGEMLDCTSRGGAPDLLENAILSALQGFEGPIAIGLRSGHVSRSNVTLTFGVQAELTCGGAPRLNLLEPAVSR
ncbi:MAG TPA: LD-carboxypeptidase [Terracidiphilus sp.]|nr:LD-carboxypeptidase [Terracidiphilus sp.]